MGAQIPGVIGDVDAAWLKSELGWNVDSMEVQQIGAGIGVSSALYRCVLKGPNCPSSVVVKLPALDEACFVQMGDFVKAAFATAISPHRLIGVSLASSSSQERPITITLAPPS